MNFFKEILLGVKREVVVVSIVFWSFVLIGTALLMAGVPDRIVLPAVAVIGLLSPFLLSRRNKTKGNSQK
jgi:hypothetical protein